MLKDAANRKWSEQSAERSGEGRWKEKGMCMNHHDLSVHALCLVISDEIPNYIIIKYKHCLFCIYFQCLGALQGEYIPMILSKICSLP